jgi:hypothetical protein
MSDESMSIFSPRLTKRFDALGGAAVIGSIDIVLEEIDR